MAKLERIYTVPLADAYETVRRKRAPRAVKILRAFISRHMKAEGDKIVLSQALNSFIWARSIMKPPRRVKVRLIKDAGRVMAYLSDEKVEEIKPEAKKEEKPKPEAKKEEKPAIKPETKPEAPKPLAQTAKPLTQNPKPETQHAKPATQNTKPIIHETAPNAPKKDSR